MNAFTHFDPEGKARMIDVGAKPDTHRIAVAQGRIRVQPGTLELIRLGSNKGDVLGVARIAAIMASKRTAELIPLCHPVALTHVDVELQILESPPSIVCRVTCETQGPTGVEMEALTAVQVALLTIYDMCKSADRGMVIEAVGLLRKSGGRSGDWQSLEPL